MDNINWYGEHSPGVFIGFTDLSTGQVFVDWEDRWTGEQWQAAADKMTAKREAEWAEYAIKLRGFEAEATRKSIERQQPLLDGEYQIWSEGYAATGDISGANYEGKAMGSDFLNAVKNFADAHPKWMQAYELKALAEGKPSIWGCQLFDNETDARKSFG